MKEIDDNDFNEKEDDNSDEEITDIEKSTQPVTSRVVISEETTEEPTPESDTLDPETLNNDTKTSTEYEAFKFAKSPKFVDSPKDSLKNLRKSMKEKSDEKVEIKHSAVKVSNAETKFSQMSHSELLSSSYKETEIPDFANF